MSSVNKKIRNAFLALATLSSAAAFVYACSSSDDTPATTIVVPGSDAGTDGSAGSGGSAGDDSDASTEASAGAAGDVDSGNPQGDSAPEATVGQTCEPSGSYDNAANLKDLLLPDGGVAPL